MLAFAGIPLTSGFTSKFRGVLGGRRRWRGAVGDPRCAGHAVIAFPYLR